MSSCFKSLMRLFFFGLGGGVNVLNVRFCLVISIIFALKRSLLLQKMSLKVTTLVLADYLEALLSLPFSALLLAFTKSLSESISFFLLKDDYFSGVRSRMTRDYLCFFCYYLMYLYVDIPLHIR